MMFAPNTQLSPQKFCFRIHFLVLGAVLVGLLVLLIPMQMNALDYGEGMIRILSMVFVVTSLWCLWSWYRLSGSLFDPYSLFFLAAVAFNGGQLFLEVLGINDGGLLNGRFAPDVLVSTIHLVLTCIVAMHLGALLGAKADKRLNYQEEHGLGNLIASAAATRWVGWGLLAVSTLPTIIYLRQSLATVIAKGYAAIYFQGIPVGLDAAWRVLSIFFVPGALFLLAGSRGIVVNTVLAAAGLVGYSIACFAIGDRGGGGYAFVGLVWLWHKSIRALPTWKVVVVLLAIAVLLPVVGSMRSLGGDQRLSLTTFVETLFSLDNPIVALVKELGTTMRTVAYTIMFVPGERNFDYGLGYLRATMTLVPSLYWVTTETYSSWLVWTVAPRFASLGGGLGFSFIAEAYANFGWIGSVVFTFLLGYALSRLARWVDLSEDPARRALAASFIAFTIQYARGESAGEIGRLFWAVLVPYLVAKHIASLRQRMRDERSLCN
jgi:oligosaccharide repeat unit polymerase